MSRPNVKQIEAEIYRLLSIQAFSDAHDSRSALYYGLYGANGLEPTEAEKSKVFRVAQRVAKRLHARAQKLLEVA